MDELVRALSARLGKLERRGARLRFGRVITTSPSLVVKLGSAPTNYTDVRKLNISLAPNDHVACLLSGNDLLVVGRVIPGVHGIVTPGNVTLTTNVVGAGSVSGAGTYPTGSTASLIATPQGGSTFVGWTGDLVADSSDPTTTIQMNSAKSVTATFSGGGATYALTTNVVGPGSVSGGGNYASGATATLTATPQGSATFQGWSGDLSGFANPASLVMDGNKSVTATFSAVQQANYTLSITTGGTGAGSATGAGTYTDGTTVDVEAIAAAGSTFNSWTGPVANPTSAQTTVLMNANKSVQALFDLIQVALPQFAYKGVHSEGTDVTSYQDADAGLVRFTITVSDGPTYDAGFANSLTAANIFPLPCLYWNYATQSQGGFQTFVGNAVSQLATASVIEVGNNVATADWARFFDFVKLASPIIHNAGKQIVLGAPLAGTNQANFLSQANSAAVFPVVDGIALHPQAASPTGAISLVSDAHDFIPARLTIWVTSIGWGTGGSGAGYWATGEAQQAQFVTDILEGLGNQAAGWKIKTITWFNWGDFGGATTWNSASGLYREDLTPKPSYPAFAGEPRELGQNTFRSADMETGSALVIPNGQWDATATSGDGTVAKDATQGYDDSLPTFTPFTLRNGIHETANGPHVPLANSPASALRILTFSMGAEAAADAARCVAADAQGLYPIPCLTTQAAPSAAQYDNPFVRDYLADLGGVGGAAECIEIANEPANLGYMFDCLVASYARIRASGRKVIIGATTNAVSYNGLTSNRAVAQALTDHYRGAAWWMVDGFAIHVYKELPSAVLGIIENVRGFIPANVPIYVTENGWPTACPTPWAGGLQFSNPVVRDKMMQMSDLVQANAQRLKIHLWDWFAYGDDPGFSRSGGNWDHFCGLVDENSVEKPCPTGPTLWDAMDALPKTTLITPATGNSVKFFSGAPVTEGGVVLPTVYRSASHDAGAGLEYPTTGWDWDQINDNQNGSAVSRDTTGPPDPPGPNTGGPYNGTGSVKFYSGNPQLGSTGIARVNWFNKVKPASGAPQAPENENVVVGGDTVWLGGAFFLPSNAFGVAQGLGNQRHYYTEFFRLSDNFQVSGAFGSPQDGRSTCKLAFRLNGSGGSGGSGDQLQPRFQFTLENYGDNVNGTGADWNNQITGYLTPPRDQWFYLEVGLHIAPPGGGGWYEVYINEVLAGARVNTHTIKGAGGGGSGEPVYRRLQFGLGNYPSDGTNAIQATIWGDDFYFADGRRGPS